MYWDRLNLLYTASSFVASIEPYHFVDLQYLLLCFLCDDTFEIFCNHTYYDKNNGVTFVV